MCCNLELVLVGPLKCLNTFNLRFWLCAYYLFLSILEYGIQMWHCNQLARAERNNQGVVTPGVMCACGSNHVPSLKS